MTGHEFKFVFNQSVEYVLTPDGWHAISPWEILGHTMKTVEAKITNASITAAEFQKSLLSLQLILRVTNIEP